MSAIEVDQLVSELSTDAPAGIDVEFDPAYFELEKLAAGTPESVMGDEVKPAEEPEWGAVKTAALALFERTRDLRVAMILAAALLKVDGLVGFRDGLTVIRGLIDKLWEQVYPKLDPSDNNDPTIRINILKGFDGDGSASDLYKLKLRLREAILTNSQQRIGKFGFRDLQIAKGEIPPPPVKEGQPKPADLPLINAAFEDTPTEDLQATHASVQGSLEDIAGIDAALASKIGAGIGPDFSGLREVLEQLQGVINEKLAKRGIGDAPAESPATDSSAPSATTGGRGVALTGEIGSRSDVIRVLDKICEYYERFEPASPVPIFMNRAKRLVTMSFVDVIKDLAPEAMGKIDLFTGAPEGASPPQG